VSISFAPVARGLDYEIREQIDKGEWYSLVSKLKGSIENASGSTKVVYIVACHLTNKDEEAFTQRERLTEEDIGDASEWVASERGGLSWAGYGRRIFVAGSMLVLGNPAAADSLLVQGLDMLEAVSEQEISGYDQYQLYDAEGYIANLLGLFAVSSADKFYASAIEHFTKQPPADSDAIAILSDLAMKGELVSYGNVIDSLFLRSYQFKQDVAYFHYTHAGILVALSRTDDALYEYLRAIDWSPSCYVFWKRYLETLVAKSGQDGALKELKEMAKGDHYGSSACVALGDCYAGMGKPDKAVSSYSKCLKDFPENKACQIQRGKAYLSLKDYKKAARDASTVLAADSANYEAWNLLGLTAQETSDAKASEYLEKSRSLAPRHRKE
jgi:tetratricopeptide (TPR) repeat protein